MGFIFTFLDYWRYIFIFVIGVPCLLCSIGAFIYFDETPRYLATKLMFDEAKIVFKRMANVNMRPPFMFKLHNELEFDNDKFFCVKKTDRESLNDIFSPVTKFA